MLTCQDLARIANDYIDGELGAMDMVSVKMHLLMCGHCRTFIGNLDASTNLMKAHASGKPNDELMRRIDERVKKALEAGKINDNPDFIL